MCVLLVGVADMIVLAVDDQPSQPIRGHVEQGRPAAASAGWRNRQDWPSSSVIRVQAPR
jgi:hypothetical protein